MNRTWDEEVQLVGVVKGTNENGFETTDYIYSDKILCNRLNVHSSEFWSAKQNLIDLKYVLEIHEIEYQGQRAVSFNNHLYKIERTYLNKDGFLELTLSDWSDTHGT